MTTIAFKAEDEIKQKLLSLASSKGISLSALIKLYLTEAMKKDLSQITENGITKAEELELLIMNEEGSDGIVYDSVDDFMTEIS